MAKQSRGFLCLSLPPEQRLGAWRRVEPCPSVLPGWLGMEEVLLRLLCPLSGDYCLAVGFTQVFTPETAKDQSVVYLKFRSLTRKVVFLSSRPSRLEKV